MPPVAPERPHHRRSRQGRALSANGRQPIAPRNWKSSPTGTPTARAATRCRTRHQTLHVERPAHGPALRVGLGRLRHRGGEELSSVNPRPHGWEKSGAGGAWWSPGIPGDLEQVPTSGLDQEQYSDSLLRAAYGTRPWAGNCGSRNGATEARCLQPGRRQSCQMAGSVAGRAR